MSNLLKKEKGFTLIEVVLVLAIVGLMMVIVLLAVSGAQKSRRDAQRKGDLNRLAASLETYASNSNGVYPSPLSSSTTTGAFTSYLPTNFEDPTSGNTYPINTTSSLPGCTNITPGTIYYKVSNGNRVYEMRMCLEQGFADRKID